jgi:hypothetical protein
MPEILNRVPIPYVTSIASIPPMTTLVDARNTPAPPIFALRAPVNTSATRTDMKVTGMRIDTGGSIMATNGRTAPIRKDAAEAKAACQGFVKLLNFMQNKH